MPVEGIIAYLLLGIDEIAIQLEEPFGILPLESLCDAVQISVQQTVDVSSHVSDLVAGYCCEVSYGAAADASAEPAVAVAALAAAGGAPAGPRSSSSAGAAAAVARAQMLEVPGMEAVAAAATGLDRTAGSAPYTASASGSSTRQGQGLYALGQLAVKLGPAPPPTLRPVGGVGGLDTEGAVQGAEAQRPRSVDMSD